MVDPNTGLPEAQFGFTSTGDPVSGYSVVHSHVSEGLSEVYECVLDLATRAIDASLAALLNQPCTFTLGRVPLVRNLRGVVRRVDDLGLVFGGRLSDADQRGLEGAHRAVPHPGVLRRRALGPARRGAPVNPVCVVRCALLGAVLSAGACHPNPATPVRADGPRRDRVEAQPMTNRDPSLAPPPVQPPSEPAVAHRPPAADLPVPAAAAARSEARGEGAAGRSRGWPEP